MAATEATTVPAWHCTLADLYMMTGRRDEAIREYESLARDGFASLPRDSNWLVTTSLIGGVCADLDDAPRRRRLDDRLERHVNGLMRLATERTRVATKAIRYALRKIAAQDAALAEHLDIVIRTETCCAYMAPLGDGPPWTI